ncbi:MAG TPA: hypothetical protein VNO55_17650, partial [Polyangia bacterium]|nr:hypothetical protein [Polyangia bacterium]
MTSAIPVLSAAVLCVLTVNACGGGSGGNGADGGGAAACLSGKIMASEKTNYAFTSTLSFPPVKVKPNSDLTLDWADVSADFVGHTLDNTQDLNMVLMMLWNLSVADLQTKLNADALAMSDLAVLPLSLPLDGTKTSADIYSLTLLGNPITSAQLAPYLDPTMYAPANHTYTMMVATGTQLGQGTRMIQSFQMDPASTNTLVKMANDSTQLTYTANLHDLTAVDVTPNTAAITLDWGQLKTNALGNPFITMNITKALVGHYTQTPAELEARFLDIQLIASALYRAEIPAGSVLDFTM